MNNKILYCLQGPPASGKSTLAKEMLSEDKNLIRLNKDDLRQLLFCGSWSQKREKVVIQSERTLVKNFLVGGKNVIIDNTHLSSNHVEAYKNMALELGAEFKLIVMKTSMEECIIRDAQRKLRGERHVGSDVIKNMCFSAGMYKQERPLAVFDLDGTLSDCSHRRRHLTSNEFGNKPNWVKFFNEAVNDTPRKDIIQKMHDHKADGCEIVISSACPEDYREMRTAWLIKNGAVWDRFMMRPSGNYSPDTEIKQYYIDKLMDKSRIVVWYDDRSSVIKLLKANGINVIDVGDGTF